MPDSFSRQLSKISVTWPQKSSNSGMTILFWNTWLRNTTFSPMSLGISMTLVGDIGSLGLYRVDVLDVAQETERN